MPWFLQDVTSLGGEGEAGSAAIEGNEKAAERDEGDEGAVGEGGEEDYSEVMMNASCFYQI